MNALFHLFQVAATFVDWCKLIQAIESTLDVREGLAILRTRASALAVAKGSGDNCYHDFLDRLLGKCRKIFGGNHLRDNRRQDERKAAVFLPFSLGDITAIVPCNSRELLR